MLRFPACVHAFNCVHQVEGCGLVLGKQDIDMLWMKSGLSGRLRASGPYTWLRLRGTGMPQDNRGAWLTKHACNTCFQPVHIIMQILSFHNWHQLTLCYGIYCMRTAADEPW